MTPEEHYCEAEYWLGMSDQDNTPPPVATYCIQRAQVHATLATITEPPLGVIDR